MKLSPRWSVLLISGHHVIIKRKQSSATNSDGINSAIYQSIIIYINSIRNKPSSKRLHHAVSPPNAAKSLQSCPTLCDPIEGSPSGSPVPGILQARTLEWVAISFSNAWKWKVKVKSLSHTRLLATPRTAAYQAPPSMGFSRQEYWSGLSLPSPPHPTIYPQTENVLLIKMISDISR